MAGARHRRRGLEVNGQRLLTSAWAIWRRAQPRWLPCPLRDPTLTNPDGIERSAYQWFTLRTGARSEGKSDEAVAAYRQALAADPGLAARTPTWARWPTTRAMPERRARRSRRLWPSIPTRPRRATTWPASFTSWARSSWRPRSCGGSCRQPRISPTRTTTWPPPLKTWVASVRQWSTCGATWHWPPTVAKNCALGGRSAELGWIVSRLERRLPSADVHAGGQLTDD